ncbi:MAG: acyl carrier protein [Flavobacterium sp.]|nr:MAG: acyl carrier protein [Flavobacterium sp.]
MEEFIENFAEQFDETDRSEFSATTEFKDLDEWDSMLALTIIAMVDEEYDKTLNGDDIKAAKTIEDLFKIVESK